MKELTAQDFRIGNWVFDYESDDFVKEYYQVEQITKGEDGRLWVHYDDNRTRTTMPEPIPLTEEWLERFGFKKIESSTCKNWYIGTNTITHDWLFDVVWLLKPELIDAPNYPFYRNGRHLIQYVHQLQNLYYALTREELTLKTQG